MQELSDGIVVGCPTVDGFENEAIQLKRIPKFGELHPILSNGPIRIICTGSNLLLLLGECENVRCLHTDTMASSYLLGGGCSQTATKATQCVLFHPRPWRSLNQGRDTRMW